MKNAIDRSRPAPRAIGIKSMPVHEVDQLIGGNVTRDVPAILRERTDVALGHRDAREAAALFASRLHAPASENMDGAIEQWSRIVAHLQEALAVAKSQLSATSAAAPIRVVRQA